MPPSCINELPTSLSREEGHVWVCVGRVPRLGVSWGGEGEGGGGGMRKDEGNINRGNG